MRLVNADNLKIPNDVNYKAAIKRVFIQQPTAFDVHSLIKKLKETKNMNEYLFDKEEKESNQKSYFAGITAGLTSAIQEIEEELAKGNRKKLSNDWILCKNEFPKEEQRVIVTTKTGTVTAATYSRKIRREIREGFIFDDGFVLGSASILAWMPAPEGYMGGE